MEPETFCFDSDVQAVGQDIASSLSVYQPASISRVFIGVQPGRGVAKLTKVGKPSGPMSLVSLYLYTRHDWRLSIEMCYCPHYRYCYCSRLPAPSQLQFDRAWNQLLGAAVHVMAMESTGQSFSRFQKELKGWVFTAFTGCKLL